MKIIIFLITTFVVFLLNSLFGLLAGFQMGPVFLYIVIYLISKFFSDRWESRKMCKSIMRSLPEQPSTEHSSLELKSHSAPQQKKVDKEKHNQSRIKLTFAKIKERCKKHFFIYLSAILSIALAFSSFFVVSFYIELKSAEKTFATYETEFSDALEMYKDLKHASDQKMERRYELIHNRFPEIGRIKFEIIKNVFSKQGNKNYTVKQLKTLGYTDGISRLIYTLWYEA